MSPRNFGTIVLYARESGFLLPDTRPHPTIVPNKTMSESSGNHDDLPVWIVDDDDVRYSIRFALATQNFHAFTFSSGEEFFQNVAPEQPGCLVVDLTMQGMSGIDVQKRLRDLDSPIKVIILSGHGTVRTAVEAMENGAVSFMEKPVDPEELTKKVREALEASMLESQKSQIRRLLRLFSKREAQIFDLVCRGMKNGEIASTLYLSQRTVESHRANMIRRLGNLSPISVLYELARQKLDESPVQIPKLPGTTKKRTPSARAQKSDEA